MLFRVGSYDGNRIADLENLLVTEDRTVPPVAFVVGKCNQPADAVLSFTSLCVITL